MSIFVGCPKSGGLPPLDGGQNAPKGQNDTQAGGDLAREAMTRTYSADRLLMIAIIITSMKRQYALHINGAFEKLKSVSLASTVQYLDLFDIV